MPKVLNDGPAPSVADLTLNVDPPLADSTGELVLIPDSVHGASRRPSRPDAPTPALPGERRAAVAERLARNRTDLAPDCLRLDVGRDEGYIRDRPQNSQTLSRHPKAALTKALAPADAHAIDSIR